MGVVGGLLVGKRVMITGASSGIGAAAARLFVAEGACVVLMARREGLLEELVGEIREGGGSAVGVVGDVTRPGDVERVVSRGWRCSGVWMRLSIMRVGG